MEKSLRIIVAQIAARTGDLTANTATVCKIHRQARRWRADLVIFPELFLIGYPPEDLLFASELPAQLARACRELASLGAPDIIIGAPTFVDNKCYNSAWHFSHNRLAHIYHKQQLPNHGVFDEQRYFTSGDSETVIKLGDRRIMLLVCEDIWSSDITARVRACQPEMVITINASPFEYNKLNRRRQRVASLAASTATAWLYVNMYGAQDELVYDGASFCVNGDGTIAGQAREFAAHRWLTDYCHKQWHHTRVLPQLDHHDRIFRALALGTANYCAATRTDGVILGLSGGIDSALTLAVAVAALGAARVTAVMLPYLHTRNISTIDAKKQAALLGVRLLELPIHQAVDGVVSSMGSQIDWDSEGGKIALQNIQSRCRANMLMALANASNLLVLVTSNKSELAMGYGTLYGDLAGAYGVLKDLDKQTVYSLARWCNRQSEQIVTRIIERPPSAELAPDQFDSDSLPAYPLLDQFIHGYVENRQSCYQLSTLADQQLAQRILTSIDRNEYKRRQAPIGPKISALAFGRDRRMPITNYWKHAVPPDQHNTH